MIVRASSGVQKQFCCSRTVPRLLNRGCPMRIKLPLIATIAVFLAATVNAQDGNGNGALLYIGTWTNKIQIIDERQQKIIGEIKLETGTPLNVTLSDDHKKLFVLTTKMGIEVVDLATRQVTTHFDLNEGNKRVYPLGAAVDPQGRYLYVTLRTSIKEIDRFKIEKPKFVVIDLQEKKVAKTFDFPKEFDQGFDSFQVTRCHLTGSCFMCSRRTFLCSILQHSNRSTRSSFRNRSTR